MLTHVMQGWALGWWLSCEGAVQSSVFLSFTVPLPPVATPILCLRPPLFGLLRADWGSVLLSIG